MKKKLHEILKQKAFTNEEVLQVVQELPDIIEFLDNTGSRALGSYYRIGTMQEFIGFARARGLDFEERAYSKDVAPRAIRFRT